MTTNSKSRSYSRGTAGVVLLVGVLAGVTVGGGVGVIAATSTKSVTVCANKKTNVLRYAKNGNCVKKTETKVVLNQTGVAGAKGDTGATGANGTNGTNGTNGVAGIDGTNSGSAITQQSVCDGSDADTIANEVCKVGMTGPGGGHIFFVDYNDQHAGFNYLEAAPSSCEGTEKSWSSDTSNVLDAVNGWAARAIGAGKANSAAMITNGSTAYLADTSGAAFFAETSTCGTKTDWFLGSAGEMNLMIDILQDYGIGGPFGWGAYWTSSSIDARNAKMQSSFGGQTAYNKVQASFVRPVRAF